MATASSDMPVRGWLDRSFAKLWVLLARSWMFIVFFVCLFLLWQFSIDLFSIPRYILPKPTMIVRNASADIPRLLYYTYITGAESVIGYLLAVVIAVPLGLAIAFSSILRRTIYPFFVSLEMTPKIAFAPVFISWLGFGMLPKVVISILVCFFPIVLNAILGFASLPDELDGFCRSTGADPMRAFLKVRLPAALPQCFVGFKYAAMNAIVGATIAEFIGSDKGLGFYIQIMTGNMRPDLAFAGIFMLTILGLAQFGLVTLVERFTIPWHVSIRRTRG